MTTLSNYVYNINPNKYGNQQEDYQRRSDEMINVGVSMVKEARANGEDLKGLFFRILTIFANERRNIAQDHRTKEGAVFGLARNHENLRSVSLEGMSEEGMSEDLRLRPSYLPNSTFINGEYDTYGKLFLKALAEQMNPMKRDLHDFTDKSLTIHKKFLGHTTKLTIDILDASAFTKKNYFYLMDDERHPFYYPVQEKYANLQHKVQAALSTTETFPEFFHNRPLMQKLKEYKEENLYDQCNISLLFTQIQKHYPSLVADQSGTFHKNPPFLKSHYIFGKLSVEIDDKLYSLAKYFTWTYFNYQIDALEHMQKHSVVCVIHQDPFLIDTTLKKCAALFEKIVLWDKQSQSLDELMQLAAFFRFLYGFCAPHFRGDGAIGDWFDILFYRIHEYQQTHHKQGTSPPFEIFCCPLLRDYYDRYKKTITIA